MHCCHTLQLLPCVLIDFIAAIKTHTATAVIGLAFAVFVVVTVLREVVVIVAASAACVSFAGESGGGVDQKEAATGLYIFFH